MRACVRGVCVLVCAEFSLILRCEKGEEREGGGSLGILGEGPGVADLQRCWGCDEQS